MTVHSLSILQKETVAQQAIPAPTFPEKTQEHRHIARRVLTIEMESLKALAESLDDNFNKAVECLAALKGHVVLTGMGKSGHIALKIAATMASTGTPAFFVHPAEASHGDLGMITKRNAVIALSDSGESAELEGILQYATRYHIPVIGITRNPQSTLGQASTVVLTLPQAEPACPLRLAPTTVTTMMLALGDALAVALMEKKGFSKEGFKEFHPGGKLGKRLRRVEDLMVKGQDIPLISEQTLMTDAIIEIGAKRIGCTAVVDSHNVLKGIVTVGDVTRHAHRNLLSLSASEVMTKNPKTIGSKAFAASAVALMNEFKITVLFVTDENNHVVGALHLHDCLKAGID
jgi:arabinose-5-phosphate isomerase